MKQRTATAKLAFVVAVVLLGLFYLGPGCDEQPAPAYLKLSGRTMGTTWNATLVRPPADGNFQNVIQAAVEDVDSRMSTYRDDSELSRFNRADAGVFADLGPITLQVVAAALQLAELSGGAFEPTILPLVEGWGFGAKQGYEQPTAEQIENWRSQMGWQKISIIGWQPGSAPSPLPPEIQATIVPKPTISKSEAGLRIDLSANAKGFGVDHAAAAIQAAGCTNFLLEVGGELRASGQKSDGTSWRIGIDRPTNDLFGPRDLQQVIEVGDWSVATSGDYRNYREVNDERVSHLIDPRTGYPITHNLASVTVIAQDCMTADGLATAISILGVDEGLNLLAKYPGTHAYFILRDGDGFQIRESNGFARFKVE